MRVRLRQDVFQPDDIRSVPVNFLHRQVDHIVAGRGTVPVAFVRLEPDRIANIDGFDGFAFSLNLGDAADNVNRLAGRVRVPGGAGSVVKRDPVDLHPRRRLQGKDFVDGDGAGEVRGGAGSGGAGSRGQDLHTCVSVANWVCGVRGLAQQRRHYRAD